MLKHRRTSKIAMAVALPVIALFIGACEAEDADTIEAVQDCINAVTESNKSTKPAECRPFSVRRHRSEASNCYAPPIFSKKAFLALRWCKEWRELMIAPTTTLSACSRSLLFPPPKMLQPHKRRAASRASTHLLLWCDGTKRHHDWDLCFRWAIKLNLW